MEEKNTRSSLKNNLLNSKNELLKKQKCTHPLWLYMSEKYDNDNKRTLFTCKCLECSVEQTSIGWYFNDVVSGDYELVKEIYENYKNETYDAKCNLSKIKKQIWFRK